MRKLEFVLNIARDNLGGTTMVVFVVRTYKRFVNRTTMAALLAIVEKQKRVSGPWRKCPNADSCETRFRRREWRSKGRLLRSKTAVEETDFSLTSLLGLVSFATKRSVRQLRPTTSESRATWKFTPVNITADDIQRADILCRNVTIKPKL